MNILISKWTTQARNTNVAKEQTKKTVRGWNYRKRQSDSGSGNQQYASNNNKNNNNKNWNINISNGLWLNSCNGNMVTAAANKWI